MKHLLTLVGMIMAILLFSGCGEEEYKQTITLTGQVATGQAAPATVSVTDVNGKIRTVATNSSGVYSINTAGLTAPLLLRAVIKENGYMMHGFSRSLEGTANITPLTTYIVDGSAVRTGINGGAPFLFGMFSSYASTGLTRTIAATNELNTTIASKMQLHSVSGFAHHNDFFAADHTGYDALLDDLDIELYQGDLVLREGGTTRHTLSYDINVSTINFLGNVYNMADNSPIAGATLSLTDRNGNLITATSLADGTFSIPVETMRNYHFTITAPGFHDQSMPWVASFALNDITVGSIAMLSTSDSGSTAFSGNVVNARSANGLGGANLVFREGYNTRIGAAVSSAQTSASGNYSVTLPYGVYTVEVSKDGYISYYENVVVYGPTMSNNNFSLVPLMTTSGFATVVLNWGEQPRDLDSHLTGPNDANGSSRFHIAYYNKVVTTDGDTTTIAGMDREDPCATTNIAASLDLDDVTSYGPETTTLCRVRDGGEYKFYVHHFSGTSTMAESPATVIVSVVTGLTYSFRAPSENSVGDNDVWHVFTLDADGNVYPVNEMLGDSTMLIAAPSRTGTMPFASESTILGTLPAK